jgi:4,5-DOPA dioxygenase extradiol
MSTTRMPAAFIGHGSPMNALETNRHTEAWTSFARSAPTPRALLVVSAHWYINATAVTAMSAPRTIHDFFGFPKQLFDIEYPAPGLPSLADEIAEITDPIWVGKDVDSWGLDHGTWSVLCHMYPNADIPVVQLAINGAQPLEYHVALGAALAPLRDTGVMIIGSGNVVHNLGLLDFSDPEAGFDWAVRFNEKAKELVSTNPGDVASLGSDPDFRRSAPTPDHFIPFLYFAGLAAAGDATPEVITDGYMAGSLSMTSWRL